MQENLEIKDIIQKTEINLIKNPCKNIGKIKRKLWTVKEETLLKKLCSVPNISLKEIAEKIPSKNSTAILSKKHKLRIKFCGTDRYKWSLERKKLFSKNNPMKRPEISKKFKGELNPMKNPKFSKKVRGDLNASRRTEFKKWISINNPMYDIDNKNKHKIACNDINRRLNISKRMKQNNPSKNKIFLEKRIKTYSERLSLGKYTITNNWKTGYYIRKDGNKEWYDSSYELIKMQEYDKYDKMGKKWTKKHGIRIPYINDKGINTYYIPDFLVNDDTLEEVKGWIKDGDELKAKMAIKYCKSRGWNYNFLLGKTLVLQKKLSYEYKS